MRFWFWLRALLGATVVAGIAIAGLSYAYWDQTVLIGSMAINPHSPDNVLSFGVTCAIQI